MGGSPVATIRVNQARRDARRAATAEPPQAEPDGHPGASRFVGDGLIATALLLAAILFNLYALRPEVAIGVLDLNDNVLHRVALDRMVQALAAGQDPTDP
jgi:hypothetical protein